MFDKTIIISKLTRKVYTYKRCRAKERIRYIEFYNEDKDERQGKIILPSGGNGSEGLQLNVEYIIQFKI